MDAHPHSLTITHRLVFACLIVSLPLVAITVFLIVTAVNKDINFGRWEKMGNEYQRPLEQLLELLPQHQALTRQAIERNAPANTERAAVARRIDAAFEALASSATSGTPTLRRSRADKYESVVTLRIHIPFRPIPGRAADL